MIKASTLTTRFTIGCRIGFRSKGGLIVNNCWMSTPMDAVSVDNEEHESIPAVDNSVQCPGC